MVNLRPTYDSDSDVLYVSVGQPRPATTDEIADGVLYRHLPGSSECVGLTVMGFLNHFAQSNELDGIKDKLPGELVALLGELTSNPDELMKYSR